MQIGNLEYESDFPIDVVLTDTPEMSHAKDKPLLNKIKQEGVSLRV